MNLSWPDEKGDMIERPIPEQFKHHIQGILRILLFIVVLFA
jgi:hypothetical protein